MLPGFRFLVAAVVLSISLMVFGLGAASLFRSAHEEFASLPVRRAAPQSMFPQPEAPPMLAMLRLEAPELKAAPVAAPQPPAQSDAAPVEPERPAADDQVASLGAAVPEAPQPADTAKTDDPKPAPQATTVALAAPPAVPAPVAEPDVASVQSPLAAVAPPSVDQPATTLTDADTRLASMHIATLDGPPVDTEPVPLPVAKPKQEPVKKAQTRPVKKRRVAARETPAAAAPAQTDPFGQPFPR